MRRGGRVLSRAVADSLQEEAEDNFFYLLLMYLHNVGAPTAYANLQRALTGKPFQRPFGYTHQPRLWDELVFIPAQLARRPLEEEEEVHTQVRVGPRALRPLIIDTPIMVTAMGTELAVSLEAKLALAQGAAANGTAINSGTGGFYPQERQEAYRYILQHSSTTQPTEDEVARADMVEILIGHGAKGAVSQSRSYESLSLRARQRLGIAPGQDLKSPARWPGLNQPGGLERLVDELRAAGGGIPVAIKLGAGDIEGDLEEVLEARPDAIVLDGGEGSTHRGPEILTRHLGIPLPHGLIRAQRFLEKQGVRDDVTLVVTGGLYDAGDYLKALALGADCIYSGVTISSVMVGLKALAGIEKWAPPNQFVFADGRLRDQFNPEEAAANVGNFIAASTQELILTARALGKSRLEDIGPEDVRALTPRAAESTGVAPGFPTSPVT